MKDSLTQIKKDYQQQADDLAYQAEKAKEKLSLVDAVDAEYQADILAAKAEGIEIGKGMIQLPDASNPDAIYTQAQMSAAVDAGKEQKALELQPEIDAAKADAQAKADTLAAALVALDAEKAAKAELQAKLDADAQHDAEVAEKIKAAAAEIA